MSVLRILIADDHTLVRSGMRALLQTEEDLEVVGEAATGEQVVTMATTLQPDVIVMDLRMPGISGIEATRRILHSNPAIRILVVTLLEEDDTLFAALRAGARGYVLKEASEVEVLRASVRWARERPSSVRPWPSGWWGSFPPRDRPSLPCLSQI